VATTMALGVALGVPLSVVRRVPLGLV